MRAEGRASSGKEMNLWCGSKTSGLSRYIRPGQLTAQSDRQIVLLIVNRCPKTCMLGELESLLLSVSVCERDCLCGPVR